MWLPNDRKQKAYRHRSTTSKTYCFSGPSFIVSSGQAPRSKFSKDTSLTHHDFFELVSIRVISNPDNASGKKMSTCVTQRLHNAQKKMKDTCIITLTVALENARSITPPLAWWKLEIANKIKQLFAMRKPENAAKHNYSSSCDARLRHGFMQNKCIT